MINKYREIFVCPVWLGYQVMTKSYNDCPNWTELTYNYFVGSATGAIKDKQNSM